MKNQRGKIHPSLSYSQKDFLMVLNMLPAAMIALVTILSLQDKKTLAYMLTRSLNTMDPIKKPKHGSHKKNKKPDFYCGCFECYTSFWHQWNTSPNKEIIDKAIEAFEEQEEEKVQRVHKKRGRVQKKIVNEKKEVLEKNLPKNVAPVVAKDEKVVYPEKKILVEVVGMLSSRIWSFLKPCEI